MANSADVIGYSFSADSHCCTCTDEIFPVLNEETEDSEGNLVHPIFAGDELENPVCGDCGGELE